MKYVQRIPGIYYTTLRDSHFSAFNVTGSFSNPLIYDMIPFVLRDMNGTQALQKLGFRSTHRKPSSTRSAPSSSDC